MRTGRGTGTETEMETGAGTGAGAGAGIRSGSIDARAQLKKSQTRSVIASAREITQIQIWIQLQRRRPSCSQKRSQSLDHRVQRGAPRLLTTHTHTDTHMWHVATSCATGADCRCLLIGISDDVLIFESA